MVVQRSPVEITAQFTRLASSERFSSVEHRNVYKHERGQCHSQLVSVNHLGCKCYDTIRYDIVVQGLLHNLLAWLVTKDSRKWNESARM